ncbi:MAG: hypothetical protein ACRCT8_03270 [Lacipirellulaceae bacterium]
MDDENSTACSGGLGGQLREAGSRDTRLIERALRERWPIPDELKAAVVERQLRIATDPKSSSREATSAARCLAGMEGQNAAAAFKAFDKYEAELSALSAGDDQVEVFRAMLDEASSGAEARVQARRVIASMVTLDSVEPVDPNRADGDRP